MHKESEQFFKYTRDRHPRFFTRSRVLDCGSYDVNGNNRHLFTDCEYVGLDLAPGPNVDIVSKIGTYSPCQCNRCNKPMKAISVKEWGCNSGACECGGLIEIAQFDTIISSNTFEHDAEWKDSLSNIYRLLRVGGLLVFSCSGPGTKEHGTINSSPEASLSSQVWKDYYKNLTIEEISEELKLDRYSPYKLELKTRSRGMGADIQFWGIKCGN